MEQGLSQSTVTCMLQDSLGFLWFGTEDGLNRYDGYGFTVYRHQPENPQGLSADTVLSLYEDAAGVLWIGTLGRGLDRFDRATGRWRNYENDPGAPDSHFKNWLVSIHGGPGGVLWIGTYGGGLYQFDPGTEQFTRVYEGLDPWIQTVHQDQTGALWIGTGGGGLYGLDPTSGQLSHYTHDPADSGSLSADRVSAIHEDRSGDLWVGTILGGLNRFDRETGRFERYQNDPDDPNSLSFDVVASIYEDRRGVLWVGTGGGGLNRLDRATGGFARYLSDPKDSSSLSSNTVGSIYEDRADALWFGTMGGGISRLGGAPDPFRHTRSDPQDANSLSNDVVRAISEDRSGLLWIGTDGGLNRFQRETGQWRLYTADREDPHSLSGDAVRAVYEDHAGRLWIGVFGGGLNRFDPASETFTRFLGQDSVVSIYQDREGVLWLGTQGQGLVGFDPSTGDLVRYMQPDGLSSDFVRTVHQDRSGILWIGTDHGLDRFDRQRGQWRSYSHDAGDPGSLAQGWVSSIAEDSQGVLWIGTAGGGLNRFDPASGTFSRYTKQDGLANDEVYGILEEASTGSAGGDLWLSTNNGLSRFDPLRQTFTNYGPGKGLGINKFLGGAHHRSSSGEMFFGGVNGFVAFRPEQMVENAYVPPIVLTSLTQNGREVDAGMAVENLTEVTFRWPDNSFAFEFAALNYTQPERNQHAYRLEGFDADWIYLGTQRAGRYTNLPGGRYTLRLKGSNNDGLWNEDGAALRITIVPPFWQRWWFWGIAALMIVGAAAGGYRLRMRNIEARSRNLEEQIQARTAELSRANLLLAREMAERERAEEALAQRAAEAAVVAERSRLARELHDAVTQTLFSASLIAETLPRSWDRDREKGQRLLVELQQLTRGALAEMRTLLLELRPAALIEANLADLLRQLAEAASGQGGLLVTVEVDGACDLPPDAHVAFYRVAQEALHNAVKHARASHITVQLGCAPGPHAGAGGTAPTTGSRADALLARDSTVTLSICDDGRGFDPGGVPPERLGLSIMQERAQGIAALLRIESQPGQGTRVTLTWHDEGPGTTGG